MPKLPTLCITGKLGSRSFLTEFATSEFVIYLNFHLPTVTSLFNESIEMKQLGTVLCILAYFIE